MRGQNTTESDVGKGAMARWTCEVTCDGMSYHDWLTARPFLRKRATHREHFSPTTVKDQADYTFFISVLLNRNRCDVASESDNLSLDTFILFPYIVALISLEIPVSRRRPEHTTLRLQGHHIKCSNRFEDIPPQTSLLGYWTSALPTKSSLILLILTNLASKF